MTTQTPPYRKLAEELLLSHTSLNEEGNQLVTTINPLIARYREVLNNGLTGQTAQKKHIIIAGAGIAGMLSAKLLKEYGHDVTILEANKSRVGGRIKTFRNDDEKSLFADDKQYGEAGAMRFPASHPLLNDYFDKYDLQTQPFYLVDVDKQSQDDNDNPGTRLYNTSIRCNSIQTRKNQYNEEGAARIEMNRGFDGSTEEQTTAQLLDAAFDPVRDLYSEQKTIVQDGEEVTVRVDKPYEEWLNGWAQVIELYDEYTVRRYLKEVTLLEESTIELIGTIENLNSRMPLSFIHSFLGRADINPDNTYKEVVGGSWNITEVLRKDILAAGVEIKFDHRMTHLDFDNGANGAGKHATNRGAAVSIRSVQENQVDDKIVENPPVIGDLMIITIPFSSMRFVRTDPDFSYGKRRAIMELHYDAATKVLLEFNQRWWEFETKQQWIDGINAADISQADKDKYLGSLEAQDWAVTDARGGGSVTDNPNRFMYYPSHKVAGSDSGVVLSSYTWADDARRWDSMQDDDRYVFALRGMALIHGPAINAFYTGNQHAQTQSWALNPYAFGEAAVFQAGQFSNLHPNIPTSEGPIHFSGEHTSVKHAWIEGSLESAIRTALEIHQLG